MKIRRLYESLISEIDVTNKIKELGLNRDSSQFKQYAESLVAYRENDETNTTLGPSNLGRALLPSQRNCILFSLYDYASKYIIYIKVSASMNHIKERKIIDSIDVNNVKNLYHNFIESILQKCDDFKQFHDYLIENGVPVEYHVCTNDTESYGGFTDDSDIDNKDIKELTITDSDQPVLKTATPQDIESILRLRIYNFRKNYKYSGPGDRLKIK